MYTTDDNDNVSIVTGDWGNIEWYPLSIFSVLFNSDLLLKKVRNLLVYIYVTQYNKRDMMSARFILR